MCDTPYKVISCFEELKILEINETIFYTWINNLIKIINEECNEKDAQNLLQLIKFDKMEKKEII